MNHDTSNLINVDLPGDMFHCCNVVVRKEGWRELYTFGVSQWPRTTKTRCPDGLTPERKGGQRRNVSVIVSLRVR